MCWGCWSSSENASMRRARSAFPFLATPRGRNWRTVSVLNPDDLIAQAAKLIRPPPKGPPLQVDLRRAISAAYYGVFHATMIAAADTLIGRVHRVSPHYALVYRSVDHRVFKTFCELVRRSPLPVKYQPYSPQGGFNADIQDFAAAASALQDSRHEADYDPRRRFRTSDATLALNAARAALAHWLTAPPEQRTAFLMLLLFPPR
jgi:hypothetical protein